MFIRKALNHFIDFHKGVVNIILHVVGFAGFFYSIYLLDWLLFAVSFIIVESGHLFNHFTGIKKYEDNWRINLWRLAIFIAVVSAFYVISRTLKT